jgi:CRISPR system Cascade subunit CasA
MRPTRTSKANEQVFPDDAHPAEAFFGMPRRLRLVIEGDRVTGVVQRTHGTSYAGWRHPLTPYYRMRAGDELLPRHPRAGAFGYRNWLGTLFVRGEGLEERAAALDAWAERRPGDRGASVIVAGWAMDNMKPRDFVLSRQPFLTLPGPALQTLAGLIEAAEEARGALRFALVPLLAEGSALDAQVESFFHRTQRALDARLVELEAERPEGEIVRAWLAELRRAAMAIFDAFALPGLEVRRPEEAERIVGARSYLFGTFAGRTKAGVKMFGRLGLEPPPKRKEAA